MHILETELSRERTRQTRYELDAIRMARRIRSARRRGRAERTV
ncbi:hypothetical protein [Nakamurella lactea]|nr:hypothetical protein [Nakamurella lactea]